LIPREIIEEVRDRSDIEQVIGTYVTLKRAGSNVKGLCPFHNEKTPSFTVYPDSQSFYCFGCGAGGDVITFVMKYNNLDYTGAIEYLASRAGVNIPQDAAKERSTGVSRKRVLELNLAAARYFRERLFSPEGAEALRYLTESRQLSMATIKHFGLGFAPNHPFEMLKFMKSQGFTDEELTAGYIQAISQKSGKPYSIFRNRIIFPIIDTSGNVIAFGGRVMDDSKPKYLNTNDTPAYKKGRNLFALNYAKDSQDERLILCEGYMDVIALHAAGFTNAVAGLGTALTSDQARLIKKYTKKVILTYDSDEAGQKATERALGLLTEVGVDTKVLVVNGAKDPDEFIKKFGPIGFSKLLNESRTKFSYRAAGVIAKHNLANSDEKIAAANEICAIIAMSASSVERDICLNEASDLLSIPKDILEQDVNRIRRRFARERKGKESRDAYSAAKGIGDKINPDYIKNVAAARAEETILGLLLGFPEHRDAVASGAVSLTAEDFETVLGRRCFEAIMTLHTEGGFDMALLGESFNPDEMGRMQKMLRSRLELSENGKNVLSASVDTLKTEALKQKAKESSDNRLAALEARRAQIKNKKENT